MGTDLYLKSRLLQTAGPFCLPGPGAIEYRHKVYVVWSANRSLIGRSATISFSQATSPRSLRLVSARLRPLYGLAAGDIVAISPVVSGGSALPVDAHAWTHRRQGTRLPPAQERGVHPCAFCDVSGSSLTENHPVNRYAGLLFRGNEVDPPEVSPTVDAYDGWPSPSSPPRSTRPTLPLSAPLKPPWVVATVSRGTVLTPGVEVICSDLDFTSSRST